MLQEGGGITCGLQLYHSAPHKLVVLQVRSGLLPGTTAQFAADLVAWTAQLGLARLVCLTSSLAHERQEHQLSGEEKCRVVTTYWDLTLTY